MITQRHKDYPWQVRICDDTGKSLAAGVLLDDQCVLTCAHVVRDVGASPTGPGGLDARLRVDSICCDPPWSACARVMPGCWVSAHGTRRGDVALLELDQPVTCHEGARLRRAPVRDVAVRVCGFPYDDPIGVWADARLGGAAYDGEWVQLNPLDHHGPWITEGYSGAGVADTVSGDVIGIVVSVVAGLPWTNAYMLPVETIVDYLPDVGPFVIGGHTSDLRKAAEHEGHEAESAVGLALTKEIGRLFAGVWSGTAVITGGSAEAVAPWLARLVETADPAARRRISDTVIAEVPLSMSIGAVDLAVDAAGRTLHEMRQRIAERFGMPEDDLGGLLDRLLSRQPPPALVIDRVDAATDVDGLVRKLLAPLAAQARRRGIRLVLGFAGQPPADLPYEVSLGPEPITGTTRGRADPLAVLRLLGELAAAEDELAPLHAHVSTRVAGTPALSACWAPRLRVRCAALAGEAPGPELAAIGGRARVALDDARSLRDQLRELKGKRRELFDILQSHRSRAERCFGAEDQHLGEFYGTALDTLRTAPCDLAAARAAVNRYADAIRDRLDDEGDGGPHDVL